MTNDEYDYMDAKGKEFLDRLKRSRTTRIAYNSILKLGFFLRVVIDLDWMMDPGLRNFLLNREGRVGLLENSIIQNPIYTPNQNGTLEFHQALAGKWAGFDFRRPSEFGKSVIQYNEGKLTSFLIDEILDMPKDSYTPTELLNVLNINHILCMESPSIDYLMHHELLEPKTYREAFQKVRLYDRFARQMDIMGKADKEVYQVTPKGNGLVFLEGDGTTKTPRELTERLRPSFSY